MLQFFRARFLFLLLVTALCSIAPSLRAQVGDGDAPQVAMGSGRMVRGTVTAVAPTQLTLKTETGEIYQVAVSPNTQVRKGRDPLKLADVHPGDGIGAAGEMDQPNKTVHALFVVIIDAEQVKKARESLGKTWIAGTITAIDDLKLTIKRSDNVTQTIEVDEGTSFKRGNRGMQMALTGVGTATGFGSGQGRKDGAGAGPAAAGRAPESITLADVKVGNVVAGQGELKHGVFFPTELMVADPQARAERRRQAGAGPGPVAEPK